MAFDEPGMRVLYAPRLAAAHAAASAAAHVVAQRSGVEVAEVAPTGRWRVSDASLLSRNAFLASDAAVSVAVGLDDGSAVVWDRLLKVVEEPPVHWWLFVAVVDPLLLPATLRARALEISPAATGDPELELTNLGWSPAEAAALVAVFGAATHLVPNRDDTDVVVSAATALGAAVEDGDAAAAAAALETLCGLDGGPSPAEVLRFCVERWRNVLAERARVAATAGNLTEFRACATSMGRCDVALSGITRNVNPHTVLWSMWGIAGELAGG